MLEAIGMLAACGGAAAALLLDDGRARQAAIAIALLAAPVLVLGNVWDEPRVVEFRSSTGELGAAAAIATIGVAALAAAFRRFPAAFPIIAVAVLPLRVPVEIGGETANLLVPLYLVIAAAFIASVLSEHLQPSPERPDPWPLWLRRLLAATLLLYAIQAIYSEDVANAIENIGFFLVPFAILFCLLAEVRWSRALLRWTLVGVAVVAAGCTVIAIYQYFARDLFLNPELFDSNELHAYFRTNSIFFDPNILGRYLALAITALAACIAWGGSRRELGLAALVCALGLIGLAFSYSITSFAALLAGLATIAVLRFGWTGAAAFAGLGLAGLAALAVAGGTPTSDIEDYRSIDSGHADLIEGGLDLARDRPVAGWGSGSFGRAFYDRIEPARTTVSHSEPITVAAEQGAIGFAVYVGLILTALATLLGGGVRSSLARSAVGACFVAMLVSSFGYTGFVIDPAVWALLALGVATRRDPPEASATI